MLGALTRAVRGWLSSGAGGSPPVTPEASAKESTAARPARQLCVEGKTLLAHERLPEALACFARAVEADGSCADAHAAHGVVLKRIGRFEEAWASLQRALELRPDHLEALLNQGEVSLQLKKHEDATDCFNLALAFDPGSAAAHAGLGMCAWERGDTKEAIGHFERAVALDPAAAQAHLHLGGLLHKHGRTEEALAAYERADALCPDLAEIQLNAGLMLYKLDRMEEAAARFERALRLKPEFAEAYFNLGNARREQGRVDEARACFEQAIMLKPDYAEACNNLGNIMRSRGAVDEAIGQYRKAIALAPEYAEAWQSLGIAFNHQDRHGDAIACYEKALSLNPASVGNRLDLALTRLMLAEFDRGWAEYEWRFRQTNSENRVVPRDFPFPVWSGESLAGKDILIWGEQGVGDELLHASMYAEVCAAARRCVIECVPKLRALFDRSFPTATVVERSYPPHAATRGPFDFQCAAGSLPRWLRPALASFPDRAGYVAADPQRVAYWRTRLEEFGPGPIIGFSWRSTNLKGDRAAACTCLDQWSPILGIPGVQWVCLQYDECAAELGEAQRRFGVRLHAFPEVDLFNDLEEAAALTRALDLVISAPTAVSVMAAALGVPTWQMSYGPDWQLHGTERNLWHPPITVFRRRWNQTWDLVIAEVGKRLDAWVTGRLSRPCRRVRALQHHEQPGRQSPETAELHLGRGIAHYHAGRYVEAQRAFGHALALDPQCVAARVNQALVLYQMGELDAAVTANDDLLMEEPQHSDVHLNLALALLARGDFARGWPEYDWRFTPQEWEQRVHAYPFPRWSGEELSGNTVLVWKEQSIGSQVLFASMFHELVERAAYCIIECSEKLVPLFARSFPEADVVPKTDPPHTYTRHGIDFQSPAGSLARWLRPTLASFPAHRGYLTADPQRVAYWQSRLRRLGAGPKIGFSWRSINTQAERALACTTLDAWRPIFAVGGLRFVCLQYDRCEDELAAARRDFGVELVYFEEIDMFNDLDETAALISALDLIVSAPTVVSVLAAALGAPTWQLHHGTDWQMHSAARHPWLPAMRRFQRGLYQPWREVLEEVGSALRQFGAAGGV